MIVAEVVSFRFPLRIPHSPEPVPRQAAPTPLGPESYPRKPADVYTF
jgi:hypothetical protein